MAHCEGIVAKDREIVAFAPQSGHSPAMAELVLEQQVSELSITLHYSSDLFPPLIRLLLS